MRTVHVEEVVGLPIEAVFELLADHADYDRLPGITKAELLRKGKEDRNGVGALRRIHLGDVVLDEEIVAFDPPRRLEYRIVASRPVRVDHKLGRVTLEPVGDSTRVTWTSTFAVRFPLIGWFVTRRAAKQFERGFHRVLRALPSL
ncbi:MAG: SRPBCC family protein [Xanthomonadales bacterium]|nr:SRPBCC family protein [Xanthomonadales bacterium]